MGWAARHNHAMWLSVWRCRGREKLRVAWTLLRHASLRGWLRGSFWGWLRGKQEDTQQTRLQAIARQIHTRAQLERVLNAVPDRQQRQAVREGLKAYLRF